MSQGQDPQIAKPVGRVQEVQARFGQDQLLSLTIICCLIHVDNGSYNISVCEYIHIRTW